MAETCERCEQLEMLAQAYQEALKNTFHLLMISLQPDTTPEERAKVLAEINSQGEAPPPENQNPGIIMP